MNLSKFRVKAFYYHFSSPPYGLKLLFELSDNSYLFFDSSRFLFGNNAIRNNEYKWVKLKNDFIDNNNIIEIAQDEISNYFIQFSSKTILHIYQRIQDLENWEQDFEIINEHEVDDYRNICNHMNEEWIEKSIIHSI